MKVTLPVLAKVTPVRPSPVSVRLLMEMAVSPLKTKLTPSATYVPPPLKVAAVVMVPCRVMVLPEAVCTKSEAVRNWLSLMVAKPWKTVVAPLRDVENCWLKTAPP